MPQTKLKSIFLDWGYIIFKTCCALSFYVALVLILSLPLKPALIVGLVPLGVAILSLLLFFCVFKLDLKTWRKNYNDVCSNETATRIIKSILLPILLGGLYLYINGEEGDNTLYSSSPVTCEMVIHPCGSSFQRSQESAVWDAADLITQPSENEIFIMTNAVVGVNQWRGECGQTGAYCSTTDINPGRKNLKWLGEIPWTFAHEHSRFAIWNPIGCRDTDNAACVPGVLYDNGIQQNSCYKNRHCAIKGWCDPITLDQFSEKPMFEVENFTIFLDLKPNFFEFTKPSWTNGGELGYSANYAEIYTKHYSYKRSVTNCIHSKDDPHCPRFLVKDIVTLADGNDFEKIAALGGQFKIEIDWSCKFDWGKDIYDCFPEFKFLNRATNQGKPKIYPKITSLTENNRTVTYSLGINISISHVGRGLQIQFFNLVMYLQFIYVSFQMIKGPFLWFIRIAIGTWKTMFKVNEEV